MKKLFFAIVAVVLSSGESFADDVKLGIVLGFTGPIESLTPPMADAAEMAIAEVNESGQFLDGMTISAVRADSTCIDSAAATSAAERLVSSDGVKGIMGADCSGVTGAILQNVALPNGIVMISPSATSPGLSHNNNEDNGLFFRTSPSDARQGVVMSEILLEQGIDTVAVSYVNNDYGKGLSESFQASFANMGGTVTLNTGHEDGKGDYSAEVAALASAGGDRLVVMGYLDQGGSGIVRAALDSGAFDTFHFPDGMIGENLEQNFGSELDGSTGQHPGSDSPGTVQFADMVGDAFNATSPFTPESYDAAALIILAMQAAKSIEPQDYKDHILDVANAPGEEIYPGELGKALEIIMGGGDIDYVGATAVELIGPGESAGNYREVMIKDGTIMTVKYR
ncbi:MAG: ABC transporter substrate-binding protein [Aestuariivita sp.]|nr:ABC transporter substrate-binding protein [Aestuariivita sp.]